MGAQVFFSSVVLQLPHGPQPDWEEGLTVWHKLKLLKGQTLGYFRERRQYSDPESRQVPAGLCSGLNWKLGARERDFTFSPIYWKVPLVIYCSQSMKFNVANAHDACEKRTAASWLCLSNQYYQSAESPMFEVVASSQKTPVSIC